MREGHPDRAQRRFEQRSADHRQAHYPPPITAAERAEFCGCRQPDQHSEGNDQDQPGDFIA